MKSAVLVATLLGFIAANAQAHKQPKCGLRKKHTVVSTVTLAGPRADERDIPVFYFESASRHDLLFFRPADAVQALRDMIERQASQRNVASANLERGLLAEIEKDLPLTEHVDIKKYLLRDSLHWVVLDELVMELLKAGRASVGSWNYFDPNPLAFSAPTGRLKLYLWEAQGRIYDAQFCTENGWEVYSYNGEDLI